MKKFTNLKTKLAGFFLGLLMIMAFGQTGFGQSDLIITGVFDCTLTGGTPKGVELYVINNIADLSQYGIGSANNGGGTDGEEFTFPADAVSAGDFIYIASEAPNFNTWFGFDANYINGAMAINGDDAIELFHNGSVIDIFGDINVDGTGEPWEYMDGWAYRNNSTGPDGTTFTLANWNFSGPNALDGETTNATAATPFPIGTYTFSSGPDVTPPTFLTGYPLAQNITDTQFDVTVQLDEPGTAYYILLTDGSPEPDVASVKTGAIINVTTANTGFSSTLSGGLTASTAYDIYFVAEDDETTPNVQAAVTKLDVTTTAAGGPTITDLFISEYIEGSSNNRALEIYNGTDGDIDLSPYIVKQSHNGDGWGTEGSEYYLALTGTITTGDVYVIYGDDVDYPSDPALTNEGDWTAPYGTGTGESKIPYFTGNDAMGLFKISGTDTTLIDVVGNPAEATAWDVAGVTEATIDHTLVRKISVASGNTNWSASAGTNADNSEWLVRDQNEFDYIGYFGLNKHNELYSFTLADTLGNNVLTNEAVINETTKIITAEVGNGINRTKLVPTFTMSVGAQTSPTVINDFSADTVLIDIVAEDDSYLSTWKIALTDAPVNTEANILTFVLSEQTGDAIINTTDTTVSIEVAVGTDVTALSPTITVSYGAQVTSTVPQDFTNPVNYTVVAEDGITTKNWTATVTVQEASAVSIHDIQYTTDASGDSPLKGELITTSGIITGVAQDGFFIQDKKGLWNGVYVFNKYDTVSPAPVVGDSIALTAKVDEYFGLTELKDPSYTVEASDVTLPEAEVITADDMNEAIEATLIKFEGYTCVNVDFDTHHNSLYVKEGVTDTLMVHNMMYKDINPVLNNEYTITGVGNWDWDNFKVEPRDSNDFVVTTVVNNPPTIDNIVLTPAIPTAGNEVTVVADYNDDVEVVEKHFYYGLDIDSVNNELTLEAVGFSGNTYRAIIPAQETGVTVYFTIEATDVEFTTTYESSYNVITGINDINMNNISIYPNPVSDMLHINNLTNVKNITISNVIGQKVKTVNNINSEILNINTSDLERGVYIISITDNNGNVRSSKLLKK